LILLLRMLAETGGSMARPYWTGQIRIALVYLPVHVYSAVKRSDQIAFHEIDRDTGERVHHRNVNEEGDVLEPDQIVKGYELRKGRHILFDEEELESIRLPSSDTLELQQFVEAGAIPIAHYEKPYYVLPDSKEGEEIYEVLRRALADTGKVGIGQITLRGREELCCVRPYDKGLMLEILRYPHEVRDVKEMFGGLRRREIKSDYVALAKELIEQNSHALDLEQFRDHYQEALKELIAAKKDNRAPEPPTPAPPPEKTTDLMAALRHSLGAGGKARASNDNMRMRKNGAPKKHPPRTHRRKTA
jgi:DNA end-binding protein Ku